MINVTCKGLICDRASGTACIEVECVIPELLTETISYCVKLPEAPTPDWQTLVQTEARNYAVRELTERMRGLLGFRYRLAGEDTGKRRGRPPKSKTEVVRVDHVSDARIPEEAPEQPTEQPPEYVPSPTPEAAPESQSAEIPSDDEAHLNRMAMESHRYVYDLLSESYGDTWKTDQALIERVRKFYESMAARGIQAVRHDLSRAPEFRDLFQREVVACHKPTAR